MKKTFMRKYEYFLGLYNLSLSDNINTHPSNLSPTPYFWNVDCAVTNHKRHKLVVVLVITD